MAPDIGLYTRAELGALEWDDYLGGRYLYEMTAAQPGALVSNVACTFAVLLYKKRLIPLTYDIERSRNRCHLSSLDAHFLDAALELLGKVSLHPALRSLLRLLIGCLKRVSTLDGSVLVNNWLLHTNLHETLQPEEMREIAAFLQERLPGRAIVFCGLNELHHGPTLASAARNGFALLASRQILVLNKAIFKSKRQYKRDVKWWNKQTLFAWEKLSAPFDYDTAERIRQLYRSLYIEHHSSYNPDYTLDFLQKACRDEFVGTWVLRDAAGTIEAVSCTTEIAGVMTNPYNGYNKARPQEDGLYAAMRLKTITEADHTGVELNMSSASLEHKQLRGGEPCLEYYAASFRHLPWRKRWFWELFSVLSAKLYTNMIRRFNT